jgi:glycosyltransferase involved in cell wall biosynthesis
MARIAMVVTNACAPDPRVIRHAKWLVQEGHEVTVHAFDRQIQFPKSELIDGVRIMRYHLGQTPYGGLINTALGLRNFVRQVQRGLANEPPEIVYCHDADTLEIGCRMKKNHKIPFVFDMHDLHHTWILMPAPNSLLRRIISKRLEKRMLHRIKSADCIITSSGRLDENGVHSGFREYLAEKGHLSTVIENRPVIEHAVTKNANTPWCIGYLGRVREIEPFEKLLQSVLSMEVDSRPCIRIAGDGIASERVRRLFENAQQEHGIQCQISGQFDSKRFTELIQEIDVMFAVYRPERGNIMQGAIPVKMFDAAAWGVPSVVNSNCLMSEIAQKENLGTGVGWSDTVGLTQALVDLKSKSVQLNTGSERERLKFVEALTAVL